MGGKPVFTVPSKTVINFKSGFQKKLLCDGPTFSTGTACAYSCSFCYVPAAMKKQEDWLREHGVPLEKDNSSPSDLKHEHVVIRRENPLDVARRQLKNAKNKDKPLVIYASPLVDVAANMDLVRETVEMCKLILAETNWHIRLLSKSNLLPKIAQALEIAAPIGDWSSSWGWMRRVIYGVSTGTLDDKLAQAFEEGCPLVSKRIQSLHWLQDNGFRTFGMICPSLPQPTTSAYYNFSLKAAEAIRAELCEHVWAEAINLRGESFTRTIKALQDAGFNDESIRLHHVSTNKEAWEYYAHATYEAHATVFDTKKLRFLQYAKPGSWWDGKPGVVIL